MGGCVKESGGGRHRLVWWWLFEEAALDDLGEVSARGDRGGAGVAGEQRLKLAAHLGTGAGEGHVVVFGGDHDDHRGASFDGVDHIEQCPQERHVLGCFVRVVGGDDADVVHDLVDEDQHRPVDGAERFREFGFVGGVVFEGGVVVVVGVEEPPQEPFAQAAGRAEVLFTSRGVVAVKHHTHRTLDPICQPAFAGYVGCLDSDVLAEVGAVEMVGVGGEMPQSDQCMGLAAAHGLSESPHRGAGRRRRAL